MVCSVRSNFILKGLLNKTRTYTAVLAKTKATEDNRRIHEMKKKTLDASVVQVQDQEMKILALGPVDWKTSLFGSTNISEIQDRNSEHILLSLQIK